MAYSSRPYARRYVPSNRFPVGVKWLLIGNVGLFVIAYFLAVAGFTAATSFLGNFHLVPVQVVTTFAVWQIVTYMFLHAGIGHILWNMLTLWMFGAELERTWGTKRFLRFYFACGIGAAVTIIVIAYLFGDTSVPTIGSSGAIYGILLAFGVMYPERELLFNFLFPIKAKYFVMIIGGIAFLSTFGASGSGVSHVAHLGGMLCGFAYLRSPQSGRRRSGTTWVGSIRNWVANYKRQRAKKKFDVYIRKHQQDRNRYTH